jgi:hypothetical protein
MGQKGESLLAPPIPVEAGVVTLTVDTNNDTVVDDKDDEAFRKDASKAFAFWESDPTAEYLDKLVDWASVRIRLPRGVSFGEKISLIMPLSDWSLRKKYEAAPLCQGKGYLCNGDIARAQHVINELSPNDPLQPRPIGNSGRIEIPADLLQNDTNWFLFKCEPQPEKRGCSSPAIELEREVAGKKVGITARRTEIKSLNSWLTLYSARPGPGLPPTPSAYSPLPTLVRLSDWAPIPSSATKLTVLVHGFNVAATTAINNYFPTYFKRLYWVGHPVLLRQGDDQSGFAHTVGISWPGDQGGAVLFGLYFPEDEFHALQTGIPLSRLLKETLDRPSSRSIDVIAHSLGNMAVHSALMQPGMDDIVDRYIMNDAAIPADTLSTSYPYSTIEKESMFPHAEAYGFGHLQSALPADKRWESDWKDIQVGRPYKVTVIGNETIEEPDFTDFRNWNQKLSDDINPSLLPQPTYELRWRQRRPALGIPATGTGETPQRGPWSAFFDGNLQRAIILNAFNSGDQILRIDGSFGDSPLNLHAWYVCQRRQKPSAGLLGLGPDNRTAQYWALLSNTTAAEEYLWRFVGNHANIHRQWAELAYWFPSVSGAAGATEIPGLRNEDMFAFGGSDGVASHTYMTGKPFSDVWGAYERYRAFLRR